MKRKWLKNRMTVVVTIGALVLALGLFGLLGPLRWAYDATFAPASRTMAGAGSDTGGFFADLGRIKELAKENNRLVQENQKLREKLAGMAETARDNEVLRQELGLRTVSGLSQVGAEVTAFQPDSYRQFVTINKGRAAGLRSGLAAMSDGVMVGVLTDVQELSSKIMLVNDPEFRLVARDQDTGGLGVLRGLIGNGLTMEKIAQTDTVYAGDQIVTAGYGGDVPAGLLIGQIRSVDSRSNAVFQSAALSIPWQMSRLKFVFVVRP